VLVFLQSYDDAPDYDVLNRLICAWREAEEATLSQCGLNSVATEYPGCIRYNRGLDTDDSVVTAQQVNRQLHPRPAQAALDILMENDIQMAFNESYQPEKVLLDPDHHWVDPDSFDWDAFIAKQYAKDARQMHGRELINYNHVDWFNYFAMIGCRTEYYFRYSGTQTKPPCFGQFAAGDGRNNTNNWRVMKDPIRISKRQLAEMHRLLRERVAPPDDPIRPCQPDTAGKVNEATGEINVARPLQQVVRQHYAVFCECINWISKWKEDQDWCLESDQLVRFYDRPYNFATNGF
jgi:Eukaryotic-type carbonic anhydrase